MISPYFLEHFLAWAPSHQTLLLFLLPPTTLFQSLSEIFLLYSNPRAHLLPWYSPLHVLCILPIRSPPIPWLHKQSTPPGQASSMRSGPLYSIALSPSIQISNTHVNLKYPKQILISCSNLLLHQASHWVNGNTTPTVTWTQNLGPIADFSINILHIHITSSSFLHLQYTSQI